MRECICGYLYDAEEECAVPNVLWAWRAPEGVWTLWRREKLCAPFWFRKLLTAPLSTPAAVRFTNRTRTMSDAT